MIGRFRDWRFRNKLLLVVLCPLLVAILLLAGLFSIGLRRVWEETVPRDIALLRLESLSREYQAEVREFVLLGSSATKAEIAAIDEDIPVVLAELAAPGDAESRRLVAIFEPLVERMVAEGRLLERAVEATNTETPRIFVEEDLEEFEVREEALEERIEIERAAADALLTAAFTRFDWLIVFSAGMGAGLGVIAAWWLARWLDRPFRVLGEASSRILDGDFRAVERIESHDEVGQLAAGFDRAAREIRLLVEEKEKNLETLRANQAQLLQSGKLAAVGELAAGVAHELNNPLSAVLTYSVLVREAFERSPPGPGDLAKVVDRLGRVETAARRCKSIADKLLTFARQDESERRPVLLEMVIDDSLDLIRSMLRRASIELDRRVEAALPPVLGSAGQLQQVVVNLVTNAAQAMSEGGRLEVRGRRNDDWCELVVTDEGTGIEPAVLERIFEPFVTTKPAGKGTGLGLSIVYGIVNAHEGEISVDSVVGRGTTFVVRLPIIRG